MEKHVYHIRLGEGTFFIWRAFRQTINENGKLTSIFLLQLLEQLLFILFTDFSVYLF